MAYPNDPPPPLIRDFAENRYRLDIYAVRMVLRSCRSFPAFSPWLFASAWRAAPASGPLSVRPSCPSRLHSVCLVSYSLGRFPVGEHRPGLIWKRQHIALAIAPSDIPETPFIRSYCQGCPLKNSRVDNDWHAQRLSAIDCRTRDIGTDAAQPHNEAIHH